MVKKKGFRITQLFKDGRALESLLENEGFGVVTTADEHICHFQLEQFEDEALTAARKQSTFQLPDQLDDSEDVMRFTRVLPKLVNLAARVVSAPGGPRDFNIQLDKHRFLIGLMSRMFEVAPPLSSMPQKNSACVVPTSSNLGSSLTRGLVVECDSVFATVTLIDIDMTEVIYNFFHKHFVHQESLNL
jgi:hypothetical protein